MESCGKSFLLNGKTFCANFWGLFFPLFPQDIIFIILFLLYFYQREKLKDIYIFFSGWGLWKRFALDGFSGVS